MRPGLKDKDIDEIFAMKRTTRRDNLQDIAYNLTKDFMWEDGRARIRAMQGLQQHLARMGIDGLNKLKRQLKLLNSTVRKPVSKKEILARIFKVKLFRQEDYPIEQQELNNRTLAVHINPKGIFASGKILGHGGKRTNTIHIPGIVLERVNPDNHLDLLALWFIVGHENTDIINGHHTENMNAMQFNVVDQFWDRVLARKAGRITENLQVIKWIFTKKIFPAVKSVVF